MDFWQIIVYKLQIANKWDMRSYRLLRLFAKSQFGNPIHQTNKILTQRANNKLPRLFTNPSLQTNTNTKQDTSPMGNCQIRKYQTNGKTRCESREQTLNGNYRNNKQSGYQEQTLNKQGIRSKHQMPSPFLITYLVQICSKQFAFNCWYALNCLFAPSYLFFHTVCQLFAICLLLTVCLVQVVCLLQTVCLL